MIAKYTIQHIKTIIMKFIYLSICPLFLLSSTSWSQDSKTQQNQSDTFYYWRSKDIGLYSALTSSEADIKYRGRYIILDGLNIKSNIKELTNKTYKKNEIMVDSSFYDKFSTISFNAFKNQYLTLKNAKLYSLINLENKRIFFLIEDKIYFNSDGFCFIFKKDITGSNIKGSKKDTIECFETTCLNCKDGGGSIEDGFKTICLFENKSIAETYTFFYNKNHMNKNHTGLTKQLPSSTKQYGLRNIHQHYNFTWKNKNDLKIEISYDGGITSYEFLQQGNNIKFISIYSPD